MLKKIKLKNSTILTLGLFIIFLGVCIGLYEYFEIKKNQTFSEMNIQLYENEQPQNIEEIDQTINNNEEEQIPIEPEDDKPNEVVRPNYVGILEIPKINLKNGFYNLGSPYNNVDSNITVINGSTYPGEENNNLILAAHSGDCAVCYFDKLYRLNVGDVAYLNYKNVNYNYVIVDIYEVEKKGTVAIYRDYNKNVLTLITCTRNSDTKQTVYILEQTN